MRSAATARILALFRMVASLAVPFRTQRSRGLPWTLPGGHCSSDDILLRQSSATILRASTVITTGSTDSSGSRNDFCTMRISFLSSSSTILSTEVRTG
jgi:hypothetical protein